MRRRVVGAVVVVALASAVAPANAAVEVGVAFEPWPNQCTGGYEYVQTRSADDTWAVPSAGVITSWSFHAPATQVPPALRFKVLRAQGGTSYLTVGRSAFEVLTANALNTFPTRIRVEAGDAIGFFAPGSENYLCGTYPWVGGFETVYVDRDTAPGEVSTYGTYDGLVQNVSAKLEPDADRDGFGDETQDSCPSDADAQVLCPDRAAPETTITGAPRKRTRKRTATFAFSASEGATFTCSIDGRAFAACASPVTRRVRRGRHSFIVVAKDAAGNVDETPATWAWKVRPRR